VVEQQAVFAPAGEQVQFDAQFGEEAVGAFELAYLGMP
jgi:hypothetical protein